MCPVRRGSVRCVGSGRLGSDRRSDRVRFWIVELGRVGRARVVGWSGRVGSVCNGPAWFGARKTGLACQHGERSDLIRSVLHELMRMGLYPPLYHPAQLCQEKLFNYDKNVISLNVVSQFWDTFLCTDQNKRCLRCSIFDIEIEYLQLFFFFVDNEIFLALLLQYPSTAHSSMALALSLPSTNLVSHDMS